MAYFINTLLQLQSICWPKNIYSLRSQYQTYLYLLSIAAYLHYCTPPIPGIFLSANARHFLKRLSPVLSYSNKCQSFIHFLEFFACADPVRVPRARARPYSNSSKVQVHFQNPRLDSNLWKGSSSKFSVFLSLLAQLCLQTSRPSSQPTHR